MAVIKKGIITAADFNAITATYDEYWKDPKDGSGNVIHTNMIVIIQLTWLDVKVGDKQLV